MSQNDDGGAEALESSSGQVQGYRCKNPACTRVHPTIAEADQCLADRAKYLVEG